MSSSSWHQVSPPTWQQHHHLEWMMLGAHGELREGLTREGMGWVGDRDLTTDSIYQWGFLLGVIPQTRKGARERMRQTSG